MHGRGHMACVHDTQSQGQGRQPQLRRAQWGFGCQRDAGTAMQARLLPVPSEQMLLCNKVFLTTPAQHPCLTYSHPSPPCTAQSEHEATRTSHPSWAMKEHGSGTRALLSGSWRSTTVKQHILDLHMPNTCLPRSCHQCSWLQELTPHARVTELDNSPERPK